MNGNSVVNKAFCEHTETLKDKFIFYVIEDVYSVMYAKISGKTDKLHWVIKGL